VNDPDTSRTFISSAIVTFPSILYLLVQSARLLKARGYNSWTCWISVLAGVSPVTLDVIGAWDTARYNSMAVTVSFLVYSTTVLYFRPDVTPRRDAERVAWFMPAMIVMLNLGSTIQFFDFYVDQRLPYTLHFENARKIFAGQEPFPPKPAYLPSASIVDYPDDSP
jgi:hypothetical protein